MSFNNYLEEEDDKPYFTTNSLGYYYDKMEGFAEKVEQAAKILNMTKEEVEKNITFYIEQNKNELDQRLAQWDGKLETFDSSVETLLSEWVDDGTLSHVIDSTLIDQKIAPVAAQLAEKANKDEVAALAQSPLRYGELEMPEDFSPVLPATFYRDNDGVIKHNMDFQSRYKNGTKIFAMAEGDNTTGDGSEIKPFKTVRKALEVAIAGADLKYEIHTNIPVINRDEMSFTQTITNKTIALISENSDAVSMIVANRYDTNLSALVGTWNTTNPDIPYTNTVGDNVTVNNVYGSELTFGFYSGIYGGLAEVTVDGKYKTTISTYNATTTYKEALLFTGLPEGNHTVVVKFIGADTISTAPARLSLYINPSPSTQPQYVTYRAKYLDESKKPKYLSNKTLVTNNTNYTWTADGLGTYSTSRGGVRGSIDLKNVDLYGLPIPLKNVTTLVECQAEKNTWFTDGVKVWVHRKDEQSPTQANTVINLAVLQNEPILGVGGVLYYENFLFTYSRDNNALMVRNPTTEAVGELCINGCGFIGQRNLGSTGNGLATENLKNVFVFDSVNAYAQKDGYNYHYASIPAANRRNCFVLEYNCKAYDLGLDVQGAGSNNASSAHEGTNILRIGTVGYRNTGATIIDVNGCYSVLYDCHARTPMVDNIKGNGTAFSFTTEGYSPQGKTHLINCGATEADLSLNIGSGHIAYINNFKSDGIVSGAGTINRV